LNGLNTFKVKGQAHGEIDTSYTVLVDTMERRLSKFGEAEEKVETLITMRNSWKTILVAQSRI
jgi:hypothetical protein